jgi:CDP-glucose 4,6-dehydratase
LYGNAFNFSNEIQITVLDLVSRLTKIMGSSHSPVVLDQASNEIPHQYLDANKARKMLHWSPLFTLEQGLQLTVAWYREFLETSDALAVPAGASR